MHRPSPLSRSAGPNTADGGAKRRTGAGTLWTCNRCNRNNEAKYNTCRHCRSPAPPPRLGGGNGSAVGGRPVSGNPFRRYIPNINSSCPSGTEGGDGVRARSGATWTKAPRLQEHAMIEDCAWETDSHINQNHAGSMIDEVFPDLHPRGMPKDGSYGTGGGGQPRPNRLLSNSTSKQQQRQAPLPRVPIDEEAAKTWIYPVNYPVREYQLQIVTEALYKNTLVSLPTGLGKTLIAAVVMYNFYRWFPEGKVVFLAPTKPLVAQQISACYDIMGLPESDTAELQGSVTPEKRRALWDERRVFYCTPQSMANDIKHKRCDPGRFVCVVVDEAHRGTGNYAYVNVIREVAAATSRFRVLALSATPGSDIKTIQQVLINLRISHIECRSEDDREVAKHTHARQIEVVKCKLGSHIDAIRQGLVAVLQPLVSKMVDKGVLYTRDPMALKAWTVIQCLHTFRRTTQENGQGYMAFEVESDMGILTKVVQAKDTLVTHGAAGCLQKLSGMEYEVSRRGFRSNSERSIMQHPEWAGLMKLLRQTAENTSGLSVKHPKLIKLKQVLREHFARHEAAGKSTRAIVFTHLRDSVEEITEFLAGEELLRVKAFIGQGNSSGAKAQAHAAAAAAEATKAAKERQGEEGEDDEAVAAPKQRLKGQTQKEQKAVVKAFFSGEFNCLVATCIAEEGLDIGEVDLIVSFDALNSPVRMVQRMGRTGRKRAGKVVVLVAEGSEESKLRNSNSRSKSITKALQDRKDKFDLFNGDDPMVPPGPKPRMVMKEMVIVEYHLSQVGGHQRTEKSSRKTSARRVGGRRSAKGGSSICSDTTDDWRLTPAQTATLRQAYMEEPGSQRYIPNPTYGWKHQRNRWAAGNVARSGRSKALCSLRDFVEHQEWELLYDQSDMQLVMANWHNNVREGNNPKPLHTTSSLTNAMPATDAMPTPAIPSRHPSAVNVGADCDVAALDETPIVDTGRGNRDGSGSGDEAPSAGDGCRKVSPAVDAGSDFDDEVMVFHARATTAQRRLNPASDDKEDLGRGESRRSSGKGDQEHGLVKGRELPRPRRSEPASSKTKRMSKGGDSASGECRDVDGDKQANTSVGCAPNASASAATKAAGGALGALQTAEVPPNRNGSHVATSTSTMTDMMEEGKEWEGAELGSSLDERTQIDDDRGRLTPTVDGDDKETQSDPECGRRCRPAAASTTFCKAVIGANNASRGRNGGSDDDAHTAVMKSEQVLQPREQQRWRCGCGCMAKAGRATCRLCGSPPTAAAGEALPTSRIQCSSHLYCETSPLHVKDEAKSANNQTHTLPTDQAGKVFLLTPNSSASCGASSSSSGRSTGDGSRRDDALKSSVSSSSNISGKMCQGMAPKRTQKIGNGRWQCGCGCSMKESGKRCVMCGQSRPPGHLRASLVRSTGGSDVVDDGGSSSLERAGSDMAGRGIGGGHGSIAATREHVGTALDSEEAGARPGESVSLAAAAHEGEGTGRWQCTRCSNEYGPSRLKCRACNIPKLTSENGNKAARFNKQPNVSQSKENDQGGRGTCSTVGFGAKEHREETPDQAETNLLSNVGKERGIREEKILEEVAVAAAEALHSVVGQDSEKLFCGKQKEDPPVVSVRDLCARVDGRSSSAATVRAIIHPRLESCDYNTDCAAPAIAASLQEQRQQRTPQSLPRATGERSGYGDGGGNSAEHSSIAANEHEESVDETITTSAARYRHGAGAGSAGPVDLCPSPRTQDSQDDDGFAELFPSLHRFEAEEGAISSAGSGRRDFSGATSQGGRTSTTDIGGNTSDRTEGCVMAMRSPLIASPPPLLSVHPTHSTAGAAARSYPSNRVSLPMPPTLAFAPTSTRSTLSPKSLYPARSSGAVEAAVSAGGGAAASAAPPTDGIAQSVQPPTDQVSPPAAPPTPCGRLHQTNDESHVPGEEHGPESTASLLQQGSGCVGFDRAEENGNNEWEDAREDTQVEDAGTEQTMLLDEEHDRARESDTALSAHGRDISDSSNAHTGCLAAGAPAPARGMGTGKSATKTTSGGCDQDEVLDECERAYVGKDYAEPPKGGDGENEGSVGHLEEKGAAHSWKQEAAHPFNNTTGSNSTQQNNGDSSGGGEGGASLEDEEDDGVCCGVCGGATSMDDDPIILCDGERCNTAVHADCYGVVEVPGGPWLCDPCCSGQQSDGLPHISPSFNATADSATTRIITTANEAGEGQKRARPISHQSSSANFATCVLCNRKGGALKLSQCGKWAHVVCVWWTPELTSDPETARPGLLSKIDPERASLTCARCHERGGAAVQCAVPHCLQACHPFCALRAGFLLREHDGVFEQYCRTHSRKERRKVDERTAGSEVSRDGLKTPASEDAPEGTTCDRGLGSTAEGEARDEGHKFVTDKLSAADTAEGSVLILSRTPGMLSWQSQAESPVISSSEPSVRRRLRKQALLSEESDDGDDGGQSPLPLAKRAGSPSVGARVSARTSDGKDTPLKVFDMAPPGLRVKQLLRGGGRGGERSSSSGYGSPAHEAGACSDGSGGGGHDNGGGDDDLVTLSQAISPVDGGRQSVKRRRLLKKSQKERRVRKVPEEAMRKDKDNGSKGKGKNRSRDFDKATYRRYIDHEAEVDDDVSDDDEAELDDYYDSQDSFVNDGPMSYETSSSQEDEGDTPSSSRDTQCDDDEDSDSGHVRRNKEKRKGKGKKRRFMDDEDEKGMYLQLLAHSQLPARPRRARSSSRDRDRSGAVQSGADSGGGRPAQRANSCGRARGVGRCAFINAVMNHAQDGGDPFDIESACGSDADLDNTQTPTQTKRTPTTDSARSPGKAGSGSMSSSAEKDVADPTFSDGEPEEEPMYSQAMRQTERPGSPQSSPAVRREQALAPAPPPAPQSSCGMSHQPPRADSDEGLGKGKENCRPGSSGSMPAVSFKDFARANTGDGTSALKKDSVQNQDIVRTQNETTRRKALRPVMPPGKQHTSATSTGKNESAENRGATSTAMDIVVRVPQHAAVATVCATSSASLSSASNTGGGKGLTAQQRQKMMENRAKALARLKQKQAARAGVAAVHGGDAGAESVDQAGSNPPRRPGSGPDISTGDVARGNTYCGSGACASSVVQPNPGVKRSRLSLPPKKPLSQQHTNMNATRTTAAVSMTQQRGKFRMTMDMDDSDDEGDGPPKSPFAALARAETRSSLGCGDVAMKIPIGVLASKGRPVTVPVAAADMVMNAARNADLVAVQSKGKGSAAVVQTIQQHERRPSPYSSSSSASTNAIHPSLARSLSLLPPTLPTAATPETIAGISATSQSSSSATSTTPAANVNTAVIPLSAPRAGALEALARELRSRPGLAVHACTLDGGSGGGGGIPPLLRNVDLVAGVQCAVCVRSRRQFVSQVLGRKSASSSSSSSSPSSLTGTPVGSSQSSANHEGVPLSSESQQPSQKSGRGNGYGGTAAASSPEKSPFAALLRANLQRYARIAVVVDVLDEKDHSRDGGSGGDMREAIATVKALRGVSVFLSRGGKETADRVVALVEEEASAGLGLPCEVTGPLLSAAQTKFLCFLLKEPTLSYPGGLFLLQAFRGRSVKDVIGSAARDFQTAVPGMTGQQAARLKRFLVSAGTSPRPTINNISNYGKNGRSASSQGGSVAGFETR